MKDDQTIISQRIRQIRKNLGLSMDEFARRIDPKAKSGTVSNWETGKNLPNNERLKKIAELGETTIDELLAPPIDALIPQYLDEIMKFEIDQGDLKFKELYDPQLKQQLIEVLNDYDYTGLTVEYGVRYAVKELTESFLDELIEFEAYQPINNENLIRYTNDKLKSVSKKIALYSSKDTDNKIKQSIQSQISEAIENTRQSIREIE